MNILSAASLVRPKLTAAEPETVGPMDMLLVFTEAVAAPSSIKDATDNREALVRRKKRVSEAKSLIDTILRVTKRTVRSKKEAEESDEMQSSIVKKILGTVFVPAIGTAIGTVFSVLAGAVLSVVSFTLSACVSAVSAAITFLLANPVVAIGLGIVALSFGLYKYFSRDSLAEELDISGIERAPVSTEPPKLTPETELQVTTPKKEPVTATPPKPSPMERAASLFSKKESAPSNTPALSSSAVEEKKKGPASAAISKAKQAKISNEVANALKVAATRVGVPLNLLTAMAGVESSFDADIAAPKGTASGLFQFLDATWLDMKRKYGAMYGVAAKAKKNDPIASSIMAAAMMKHEGYPAAVKAVGGPASITDIYLTHFLGASGGAAFIRRYQDTPNAEAAKDAKPLEVKNNYSIFYKKEGKTDVARTYQEIYTMFANKLSRHEQRTAEVENIKPVVAQAPADSPPTPVKVAEAERIEPSSPSSSDKEYIRTGRNRPLVRINTGARA